MLVLQGADILPRLKRLVIRGVDWGYRSGHCYGPPRHNYGRLLSAQWWKQRHGLGSFKLSLRFSVEPADHLMDEFDALSDAGVHVRVTRDQNVLLDTLQP